LCFSQVGALCDELRWRRGDSSKVANACEQLVEENDQALETHSLAVATAGALPAEGGGVQRICTMCKATKKARVQATPPATPEASAKAPGPATSQVKTATARPPKVGAEAGEGTVSAEDAAEDAEWAKSWRTSKSKAGDAKRDEARKAAATAAAAKATAAKAPTKPTAAAGGAPQHTANGAHEAQGAAATPLKPAAKSTDATTDTTESPSSDWFGLKKLLFGPGKDKSPEL
jgi:hypothetical protein